MHSDLRISISFDAGLDTAFDELLSTTSLWSFSMYNTYFGLNRIGLLDKYSLLLSQGTLLACSALLEN